MTLRTILFALLIAVCLPTLAQSDFQRKKLMKDVRTNNKAEKYAASDALLRSAFDQHVEARTDAELCYTELMVLRELVKQQNRAIFLNQKPDTAKYFGYVLDAYRFALLTDSLDQLPDTRGRIKPRYTSAVGETLNGLRNNLRSGGKYFYKHGDFARAIPFFETYLTTAQLPQLNAAKTTDTQDDAEADTVQIAVLLVVSAFNANEYDKVLRYVQLAERDSAEHALVLELEAKAAQKQGYELRYLQTLQRGFDEFPLNEYFYQNLLTHYTTSAQYEKALQMLDRLLELQPTARKFLLLKGQMLRALNRLDEAENVLAESLAVCPNDAELYANLGEVQLQQARDLYDHSTVKLGDKNYNKFRRTLNSKYEKAMQSFEAARRIDPQAKQLWLTGLRETYYKLNKGHELRALEQIDKK